MSALPRTIKVELTSDEFVITARMLCQIDKSDNLYPAAESAFTKLFKAAREANAAALAECAKPLSEGAAA